MSEATSRDDFADKLNDRGVVIEKNGKSKKYGEYFTYVMTDTSNFASEKEIPKRGMRVRSYTLGKDYMPETLDEMLAEKQVNTPEPNVSYAAPAPTEEEIAEKEKQEEEANEFAEWTHQHGYDYMDSDGNIDLDAYEKALKAFEARNDEAPEEIAVERSSDDLSVSEPVIKQPVKAPAVPQKVSESAFKKQSYQQQLINKIQDDVASMDARLDDIPDDENYFGS